jgi:hypothetical protein
LKLAKIFNQYDTKEQVLQLFDHPNIEIRIEAIELVSPLGFFEATSLLQNGIRERSTERSLLFLKWVKNVYQNRYPFCIGISNHEIYDIRKSAEVIMHTIDPEDTYTIYIS